jgi:uncharacterized protein (DUF362 family)
MTSHCTTTRREFFKNALLGTAVLSAFRPLPGSGAEAQTAARPGATAPGKPVSQVALTTGNERADLAFRALEPFKKQIAAAIGQKRIILKPNNVHIDRPLCASHADNLEGILEFLKSIGKTNVTIAESPSGGSTFEGFANYGYNKFIGKYDVKLLDIDQQGFEVLHCIDETDLRPRPCRVSKLLLDPDNFIISAAKFKTHMLVGVTLSLKNIVVGAPIKDPGIGTAKGPAPGGKSDKPLMHGGGPHGINYNLFTLSSRLHPHLAVIDGYEGMEGQGPASGTPVNHKVCVASLDWLAADRVATELMGVDFSKIGYLTYCAQTGTMGQADLSRIEILGPVLKDHIRKYQLPKEWDQLVTWQQPIKKT